MFSLLKLYKITQRHTGHDIMYSYEDHYDDDGQLIPDSWDYVEPMYGYALHPSIFQREEGGQSSRKDSFYVENLSIERVDTLPEGYEIDTYGIYKNNYKSFKAQLMYFCPIFRVIFNPMYMTNHYFRYTLPRQWREFKVTLKRNLTKEGRKSKRDVFGPFIPYQLARLSTLVYTLRCVLTGNDTIEYDSTNYTTYMSFDWWLPSDYILDTSDTILIFFGIKFHSYTCVRPYYLKAT
jgi:hypothetical protein